MGLLDDAIKEHLELKRRRGADPTEVERLEREALGPVRPVQQDPAAAEADYPEDLGYPDEDQAPDDLDHELGLEHEPDYEHEEPEFAAPESHLEPEYPSAGADLAPDPMDSHGVVPPPEVPRMDDLQAPHEADVHAPEDGLPPHEDDLDAREDDLHVREDDLHAPPSAPLEPAQHDLGAETAEYDVEAEHAEAEHAEAEHAEPDDEETDDMLEETPEFLQDAPDHDRLWFEQRPPRDFDFDG